MKKFGYPYYEKLKSKKDLENLFKIGKWIHMENIRVVWCSNNISTRVGVSVSKRFHKKAVSRNRIKRLLREVYRLNKVILHQRFGENFHMMIFWNSSSLPKGLSEIQHMYEKICSKKNN